MLEHKKEKIKYKYISVENKYFYLYKIKDLTLSIKISSHLGTNMITPKPFLSVPLNETLESKRLDNLVETSSR